MTHSVIQAPRPSHQNSPPIPAVTTALADDASGRGNRRLVPHYRAAAPVIWIEPYEGWSMWELVSQDGDRFFYSEYIARGTYGDVLLDVSRFHFTPTQERFDWFIRNQFPVRRGIGPWDNSDIDWAIAHETRTDTFSVPSNAEREADACASGLVALGALCLIGSIFAQWWGA